MPSVIRKLIADKVRTLASERPRLDRPSAFASTPPKRPVHLLSETMLDVALFLDRSDLDAVQFSCQRYRSFIRDNAHLVPLRDLALISFEHNPREGRVKLLARTMERPTRSAAGIVQAIEFNGTRRDVLREKDKFQNAVRYSVARRLQLVTPKMEYDVLKELFGDTPLTIRVSSEVCIGGLVMLDTIGIQELLRRFALINRLKITTINRLHDRNPVVEKLDDCFLQWCIENSITQLELDTHAAVLSGDAVLDFCFGPHGTDNGRRYLKTGFRCSADFVRRLVDANRRCSRSGPVKIDIEVTSGDAPDVAELAPYQLPTQMDGYFRETTAFLLPDKFDITISQYGPDNRNRWNGRIQAHRHAQRSE